MNRNLGYSLVELAVVIGIVALFLVFAVPQFTGTQDKAKDQIAFSQLIILIEGAIEYRNVNQGSYVGLTNDGIGFLRGQGYSLQPFENDNGSENPYGLGAEINIGTPNTNAVIIYNTPDAEQCRKLLERIEDHNEVLDTPGNPSCGTGANAGRLTVNIQ